jgi:hypothetical protein
MIVLLCDRIPLIVTMIVRFDKSNSVRVKKFLREHDKNLVMVRMIVPFDEETGNGKNECTVGPTEE